MKSDGEDGRIMGSEFTHDLEGITFPNPHITIVASGGKGAPILLIVLFSALGGTTGSIITGFVFSAFSGQTAFYLTLLPIIIILLMLRQLRSHIATNDMSEKVIADNS
mgnify:CR=1 FL=1